MNPNPPPVDEATFLRDLVKTARQRPHLVTWKDRDGTERHTTLSPADAGRVNGIAHRERISMPEVLRRAAHVPVAKGEPRAADVGDGTKGT